MRVILTKNVPKVGKSDEIVLVKDGFALNYLLPQGLAKAATVEGVAAVEGQKARQQKDRARTEQEQSKIARVIDGRIATIIAKANASGTLFAAVHADDVAEAVKAQLGVSLPSAALQKLPVIKRVGTYDIGIQLSVGTVAKLKVVIESKV